MSEKIKVLSIGSKKAKTKKSKGSMSLTDSIEMSAPDMYEFIKGSGEEEGLKLVNEFLPEIIWIFHERSMDSLGLLKKIKQLHPSIVVFIFLIIGDDEQEMIDEYTTCGAYKCYCIPPFMIDTLVHDMYVALNLE